MGNQEENKDTFIEEWENFKFNLLSIKKKMGQFVRKPVKKYNFQKYNSIEPVLKQICAIIDCEQYPIICSNTLQNCPNTLQKYVESGSNTKSA